MASASTAAETGDVPSMFSRFHNNMELEPIAIVGLGLKFPGDADTAEGFWNLLLDGRSTVADVPKDRWNIDAFYHPNPDRHDAMSSRRGHFLKEDVSLFDAPFFSIPYDEAVCMDPQQRSLLECAYHALENAGIPLPSVVGTQTSCYVGSFSKEYSAVMNRDPQLQARYSAIGTGTAMLSNRLSWFYDFRGPSISLDTACSSSLIALHLAVQSIRSGESDVSLVAGSNLMLTPEMTSIPLSTAGFMGRDGICYSFDHRANGYARGEGTAVLVLKPLRKALDDNDTIRAVIRNTGANMDGRTPGITQPSREAQAALIRETYMSAGLDFSQTGFFEAHGTGTPLGDPREAGSIGDVFKDHRKDPIIVGAVKSNIGHLEGASGLAGLIKAVRVLETGLVPGNAWFERLNPEILADDWKLKFPTETMLWPRNGLRRASVNSFGYGGANAHVILDDAYHFLKAGHLSGKHQTVVKPQKSLVETNGIASASETSEKHYRLFVWSTSDEGGIDRMAEKFGSRLKGSQCSSSSYMRNLAYTLSSRRTRLPWKSFLVAGSSHELQAGLQDRLLSKPIRSSTALDPSLAFILTGQGAHWVGMGRELAIYPAFLASLRQAEESFGNLGCNWKVTDVLLGPTDPVFMDDAGVAQPLCTVLQMALVDLLATWGITPKAVVGHSSGEIAAAYCAGGLSRESAYKVAYFRGALASNLARSKQYSGSMLAASLSESDTKPYLNDVAERFGPGRLVVGCVNSPQNVTLTGDEVCIDFVKDRLDERQIFTRKLRVPLAYHSWQMEQIAGEYAFAIQDIISRSPDSEDKAGPVMLSSVTGGVLDVAELSDPSYWARNMVSQVKFGPALAALARSLSLEKPGQTELAPVILIEVGPHGALRRPVQETLNASDLSHVSYEPSLRTNVDGTRSMLELIGKLHCAGARANLAAVNEPSEPDSPLQLLVDLPEYPFNHSQGYWLEGRVGRNYRFPEFPRHELLGARVADWNPLDAKWRNIIRVSELPWIRDHCFNGSVIYPAAGFLVMAIEAARPMANPGTPVTGYSLENVSFHKALLVNLTQEGVETQLSLRPLGYVGPNISRYTFSLYQAVGDDWVQICDGSVVTHYGDEEREVITDTGRRKFWADGIHRCNRAVGSRDIYENLASCGFGFGPTFQALTGVRYNHEKEATATIDLRHWMSKVSEEHFGLDHVIHPTALDAFMQLTAVAESDGTWSPIRTMVPSKLGRLWVSNDLLAHVPGQQIQALTHPTFHGYRDCEFTSVAYDVQSGRCQIFQEGYRATAITNLEPPEANDTLLALDVEWKPDIDLMTREQLAKLCEVAAPQDESLVLYPKIVDQVELVCLHYLKAACEDLACSGFTGQTKHSKRYIEWMNKKIGDYEVKIPQPNAAIFDEVSANLGHSAEIDLIHHVGKNLPKILTGRMDALELLFGEGNMAEAFYHGPSWAFTTAKVAAYIDLLAHRDPQIRILEVGAGTGGCTAAVLDKFALRNNGERGRPRLGKYTYTDISPGFFASASDRFRSYLDVMEFKTLDVERDPTEQGFEPDSYDVVVASAVLHATSSIEPTLANLHKLLKPGGKAVLIEPCNLDTLRTPFIFGVLPGWWLSTEENRYWSPLLSNDGWDQALRKSGFDGTSVCLPDFPGEHHTLSMIASTATKAEPTVLEVPTTTRVVIITAGESALNHPMVHTLKTSLGAVGFVVDFALYDSLRPVNLQGAFCISLLELERPFLVNIEASGWECLHTLVQYAAGILWITRGREEKPELGIVTGLGRGLLSEYHHFQFVELALEAKCTDATAVQHVMSVLLKSLQSGPIEQKENEFEEHDGILRVNRLIDAKPLHDFVTSQLTVQQPQLRRVGDCAGRLSLSIRNPGLLDTLYFEHDAEYGFDYLLDGEVEVDVKAIGLNLRDCLIALGQIPASSIGMEVAGVVRRVGAKVLEMKPGDRVCGLAPAASSTIVRAQVTTFFHIPDHLSFNVAASIPCSFTLAYHALNHLAHLQSGETVLIHSGAGGIGQAAIQLAMDASAEVYTTVSSPEKKELVAEMFGIPEERIFVGRDLSFVPKLKELTGGVDVVLNRLSGEGLRKSLDCLRPFGRLVDISTTDNQTLEDLPSTLFSRNITYSKVDLNSMLEQPSHAITGKISAVLRELLVAEHIHPPSPINVFTTATVGDAFRALQTGQNAGKTVVSLNVDDHVPVVSSSHPSKIFRDDASYVIVGGLGGLGKTTARWMVDRGARNLILLGRSGTKSPAARDLVAELEERGVRVEAPPCDIGDYHALSAVLAECAQTMPPIRGCIQGAMVLRDNLFDIMSLEEFHATLRPKVSGSWNLHCLLPSSLDFFVMLSSAGGVLGTRGQSNYASGNTYQDSLARYRVSRGQPATALDLGLIVGVGFAAENTDALASVTKVGYRGIPEREYLALMDYLCHPQRELPRDPSWAQVVTGIEIPRFMRPGHEDERKAAQETYSIQDWMRWVSRPLFRNLSILTGHSVQSTGDGAANRNGSGDIDETKVDFAAEFAAAEYSQVATAKIVMAALKEKLARTLRMPKEDVETQKPIHAYGVDSLVAVDLRYWMGREIKASLSVFEIMAEISLGQLSSLIAERSALLKVIG